MATRTITTKLALNGEAEYKSKLKSLNSELALHKSELEKVNAENANAANTQAALQAKIEALEKMIATLTQRHEQQAAMLEKARQAEQQYRDEAEKAQAALEALGEDDVARAYAAAIRWVLEEKQKDKGYTGPREERVAFQG